MWEALDAMVRSAVTRGKVMLAAVAGRTQIQAAGLANEVISGAELLLPPGYCAIPAAGADVCLLQVLGSRDHVVALGGDMVGEVIAGMAAGERGMMHPAGSLIWLRNDGTVTVQDKAGSVVKMMANGDVQITGRLLVSGDIIDNNATNANSVAAMRRIFDEHEHYGVTPGTETSGLPTVLM
ncbi:MAG: phage baseplate assembly protein [Rhodospirillales bacterium]|nr:phage baseplate assembly protein [Rhodospirillales bacterium]